MKTCEAIDPTLLLEMEGVPNNEVMPDGVLEEHPVACRKPQEERHGQEGSHRMKNRKAPFP